MDIKLHLSDSTRKELTDCLRQVYGSGQVRVIRRMQALLHLAAGQTVRDYLGRLLARGVASLTYRRSSGRPGKLTQTQRQELAAVITAEPLAAGSPTGCWRAMLIGDWLERHLG